MKNAWREVAWSEDWVVEVGVVPSGGGVPSGGVPSGGTPVGLSPLLARTLEMASWTIWLGSADGSLDCADWSALVTADSIFLKNPQPLPW